MTMRVSLSAMAALFLASVNAQALKECEECWTDRCPELTSFAPPCPKAPPKPPKPKTPAKPSRANVWFESVPSGARVVMDGKVLCSPTPCEAELTPGRRLITMELERHESAVLEEQIFDGAQVTRTLTPTFGWITVQTVPSGLGVRIDGVSAGVSPIWSREAAVGSHGVEIDNTCYEPGMQLVSVSKAERKAVTLTAIARNVQLDIGSVDELGNPTTAEVRVDGVRLGTAPGSYSVPVCSKSIALSTSDGRRFDQALRLTPGVRGSVTARFAAPAREDGGLVTIETSPPGLPVAVNGSIEGRSPVRDLRLAAGTYTVSIPDDCFQPASRTVTVTDGSRPSVMLNPVRRTARVEVRAEDVDGNSVPARVKVDGQVLGSVPGTYDVSVCAKTIDMVANRDRYETWSGRLSLVEGGSEQILGELVNPDAPSPEYTGPSRLSLAFRVGSGGQTGILGAGLELRWSFIGLHVGFGGYLTGGLTFGGPSNRGGFYVDLHGAYGNPRKLYGGLESAASEKGFGGTLGWDFRPVPWLSLKLGAGAAYSTANGEDWKKRLLLLDGQIGFVL